MYLKIAVASTEMALEAIAHENVEEVAPAGDPRGTATRPADTPARTGRSRSSGRSSRSWRPRSRGRVAARRCSCRRGTGLRRPGSTPVPGATGAHWPANFAGLPRRRCCGTTPGSGPARRRLAIAAGQSEVRAHTGQGGRDGPDVAGDRAMAGAQTTPSGIALTFSLNGSVSRERQTTPPAAQPRLNRSSTENAWAHSRRGAADLRTSKG